MKKILLASALVFSASVAFSQSKMNFTAVLANTEGKTITKESIMAEPVLLSAPVPSAVSSYSISILPVDKDLIGPYSFTGNKLDQKTLDVIKGLKKGDKIFIDNIKVSSGKEYPANSVVYTIEK